MAQMKALVTIEGKTAGVQDVARPQPSAGEILVKVHYVAQNPTDWKAVSAVPAGRIIGCDFAGTVEDSNGSAWRPGQRVAGFVQGTTVSPTRGAFAEYVVLESSLVYEIPEGTSFQEAAVMPLAFATAVQALFQRLALPEPAEPTKGPVPLLVNGGASSVGQYAIQLGKLAGLHVVATGSKKNHELLKSLGADAVVDYTDADWPGQVRGLTHNGLRHAFDCIAEKGTVQAVAKALSPGEGGHVVTLLPVGHLRDSGEFDNSKVRLESTIVYTVFERPLKYKAFDNCGPATPQDKAVWEKYLGLLPELLSSAKIKPNPVSEKGGIGNILTGFKEQQDGRVSAEKFVYQIV
ncbi:uncharacterized protein A1O9_03330 [Exophiala aquamarina CBS 119918]|uniref:Enoyl reductase (ER) domain-containing protein n=1 Tax=Exophiala aquamarina CBS 119918 TaxID=1182545 RepID=A0A072Q1M2_9EURO|nr:uncharacterized protein A1O9_03330 [Exophiala aquamarina CBS 119918]KEF61760.1 hypothetical protein A1O9_03330 [Exophiala aquamarina CBS 119918]